MGLAIAGSGAEATTLSDLVFFFLDLELELSETSGEFLGVSCFGATGGAIATARDPDQTELVSCERKAFNFKAWASASARRLDSICSNDALTLATRSLNSCALCCASIVALSRRVLVRSSSCIFVKAARS